MIKKTFKDWGTLVKISSVEGFREWLRGMTGPLVMEDEDPYDWAYMEKYNKYVRSKLQTLKWFEQRIGKRVYRDSNHCNGDKCKDCKMIEEVGIIVADEQHADYLYNMQLEYAQEGEFLNYRDEK